MLILSLFVQSLLSNRIQNADGVTMTMKMTGLVRDVAERGENDVAMTTRKTRKTVRSADMIKFRFQING